MIKFIVKSSWEGKKKKEKTEHCMVSTHHYYLIVGLCYKTHMVAQTRVGTWPYNATNFTFFFLIFSLIPK